MNDSSGQKKTTTIDLDVEFEMELAKGVPLNDEIPTYKSLKISVTPELPIEAFSQMLQEIIDGGYLSKNDTSSTMVKNE